MTSAQNSSAILDEMRMLGEVQGSQSEHLLFLIYLPLYCCSTSSYANCLNLFLKVQEKC